MEEETVVKNTLPDLTEVLNPWAAVPALLTTTIPEDTVITTRGTTFTVPGNTQILVPLLPESIVQIAKVPDVVSTEAEGAGGKPVEVVKISQVLPGYAPSYAPDYMPNEVNRQSFTTFANTISFNISRYPALSEVTDSRNYANHDTAKNLGPGSCRTAPDVFQNGTNPQMATSLSGGQQMEYVPAEYMRGADSYGSQTVSASQSVVHVKPEVLSSGRILTSMTPFPINTILTDSSATTTTPTTREQATAERLE